MESGLHKMIERVDDPDGPFYTIQEVADQLEVHKDTVKRWGKKLGLPTHRMPTGDGSKENAFVWLYTRDDVHSLRSFSRH